MGQPCSLPSSGGSSSSSSGPPDTWNAAAIITICEGAIILVLIVIAMVFGYRKRLHKFRCMTARHSATSPYFPWYVLAIYRGLVALYCQVVLLYQFISVWMCGDNPLKIFSYYTVWNFTLLIVYFTAATVWSVLHWKRATSDTLTLYFGNFLVVAFNVEVACVFLVDTVTWGILFPPAVVAGKSANILNFESISEHGLNGLFMIGEFALNNIPIVPFHAAHMMAWAGAYLIWAWFFYAVAGIWRYAFLNIFSNLSPMWYFVLPVAHLVFFFALYGVYLLKQKALLYYGFPIVEEKPDPGAYDEEDLRNDVFKSPSSSYSAVS